MKLRHQIAVLLGVPLILVLFFCGLLLDSGAKVESAAKAETMSKEIIAATLDVRSGLVQYMSVVVGRQLFNPAATAKTRKRIQAIVKEKLKVLSELTKNDPGAKPLLADYVKALNHFDYIISEVGLDFAGDTDVYLTTFIQESDYLEELVATFHNVTKAERKLVTRYRPVDKDLMPESFKARANLRMLTVVGSIAILLIVALLYGFFGRKNLHRLGVLMKNIELFSTGKSELESVGGTDELSELDTSFRNMADARFKAEEIRRSLVAMVSHDIRSPLTSVGLNLSMIMEMHSETLDPKVREKIRKTEAEISRLIRLADGLLEIEKIEDGSIELEKRWIDASSLIETAKHAVIGIADSKEINVVFNKGDCDEDINCDPDRIIQVLVNLLSNAIKFSPRDSTLTINVLQKEAIEARFEVIDQGPGIDEVDQMKLFLKFQQLDQIKEIKKTGSGLGLYITRMLVEAHGGKIGYKRTETGGSCFWFVLTS